MNFQFTLAYLASLHEHAQEKLRDIEAAEKEEHTGTVIEWHDRAGEVRTGVFIEYRADELSSNDEVFAFQETLEYMLVRSHDEDHCLPAGFPFQVRYVGVER